MRTTLACVACTFLSVAGPVALTHCSGSSTGTPSKSDAGHGSSGGYASSSGAIGSSGGQGDDGGTTSSSGAGSSGGDEGGTSSGATEGGTSSGGGEGGTGSSSGSVTPVPEGGAPSDPNSVSCGSTSCNTTTQYCCVETDGGACTPYNSGSCSSNIKVSCNEAADCASGVCCQPLLYGAHSTSCLPSCPGPGPGSVGDFQLCRTDAECGSADAGAASQKCVVQMCSVAAGQPQNVKVEACAYYTIGGGLGNPGGWGALPGCTAN